MKNVLFIRSLALFFVFLFCTNVYAQVGIGTTTPRGALEVNSNDMGLVIPIVTDLNAVTTPDGDPPVDGTIVFEATNARLCLHLNGRWSCFGEDGNGGSTFSNVYPPPEVFTTQEAYLKASNIGSSDQFGYSVSISDDGNTLVVGALGEGSNSATDQNNNSASFSGAVYVFTRSGTNWTQQAYLKASNIDASDQFGYSVSLSGDGNTLAVGSYRESSNSAADQSNNSLIRAGAVYMFTRSGTNWTQQAYLKASNIDANDQFGYSVSLSGDGNTLAVGSYRESSNSAADQSNNSSFGAGAVYMFTRSGTNWSQQAYLKASNIGVNDEFGTSVALSDDGNTLAVGAIGETSNSAADQSNNSLLRAGAVYMFTRSGTNWTQQAYLKASNIGSNDMFGISVSLSSNGNTLAVGADREGSNSATDQSDNSALNSGAVYVFTRSGTNWTQEAYLKASNIGSSDEFGEFVSLSNDDNTLAVSARRERSNSTTDQSDNSAFDSGAAYVFTRSGTSWTQKDYLKASNFQASDSFGSSIALSGDGSTLAVGASGEGSNSATDQNNNSASFSGAVYVFID